MSDADSSRWRSVVLGPSKVEYGPEGSGAFLQPLNDSSLILERGDWVGLRSALARDGYLFLPGSLPAADVLAARRMLLSRFSERKDILNPDKSIEEGILAERCGIGCVPFLEGRNEVTHSDEMLRVFEGEAIQNIFRGIFATDAVRTFDFKWLRAVPKQKFTGAHVDAVYMSRGSSKLLTSWIPFGPNPLERGALCVLEKSHNDPNFERLRSTYGKMDHERDRLEGSGWLTDDPRELHELFGPCQWKTADFKAGDLLLFTMQTVHMSTTNVTDYARVSADVRWQPASDPADPRYVADGDLDAFLSSMKMSGAHSKNKSKSSPDAEGGGKTMTQFRIEWGFGPPKNPSFV